LNLIDILKNKCYQSFLTFKTYNPILLNDLINFAFAMSNPGYHSQLIKALAKAHGFVECGIAKADFLETEAPRLENWLKMGYQGEMKYLENHFDKRLDPRKLVPGAKSVVSLLYNYFPKTEQNKNTYQFAKYAYGEDYHQVVKDKCMAIFEKIQSELGQIEGRCFVDSAPVLERAWAEKTGIGWIGKHGLLINKKRGSFFFLAELILDLECEYDVVEPINHCGTCNKCVDHCPTEAILPNKTLNAQKCISYLTIELKSEIPTQFQSQMNNWAFGCDICQDVCPWNRFSSPHQEPKFIPKDNWLNKSKEEWNELNEEQFKIIFKNSAIKRTKYVGLKRNFNFLKEKE
jgi:epoxyqueuosine reductase